MTADFAKLGRDVIVADGAWSTVLRARGVPPSVCPETVNLTAPGMVESVAREYIACGARIISTNTFGAGAESFRERGETSDALEVCRAGAAIARKAAGDSGVWVAGVIGPSGRLLAVREASESELADSFAAQAKALAEGGADLIVLETFSELREILVAVEAVRGATSLPVVACMSFDSGPQRTQTVMGAAADVFARTADEAGADAIGANCGGGIATALPAIVALRGNTRRPVWAKPSVGLPDVVDGQAVYPQTPDEFGEHVPELLEAGVNVIGGCCGVGPDHIKRVAALVASFRRKRRPR
ncbi:MAG: homocysteine S-methyltransferase family protein [Phycisphaerae bacterium]|jgi:5-methyltetrahydrofolate--homocysteine methyltransferase